MIATSNTVLLTECVRHCMPRKNVIHAITFVIILLKVMEN